MLRAILGTILFSCASYLAFAQSSGDEPKFEAADVHVSPKSTFQFPRSGPVRGGRYEVQTATMVDLIRMAYGYDPDKILGGPSWLEMARFDITGKVPADSTPESHKLMLQALLRDRFKLVFHKDTKALPTYALIVGKKPQLKEASGSEDTGCRPQTASGTAAPGGVRLMMAGPTGATTTIDLGPGMTIQYMCRNMTMAAFAAGLRGMIGASLGTNPVTDETGLKGNRNFDLRYSMQLSGPMMGNTGDRITFFEAVEKQLGLKLEERPVATPVLVVDSVNRSPGENPPGTAEALPPIPVATEFEVATVKPSDPDSRISRMNVQPGGRFVVQGMPLRFLISRAFASNNNEEIAGLPAFAQTDRYDITAKVPAGAASIGQDMNAAAPMILALLVDRFKMKYHTEERPVTAYALTAGKPKMKKADPASRTFCKYVPAPPTAPQGSRVMSCQNITMAELVDRLQSAAPELAWPVADATGIEGGWDFTLTYSMRFSGMAMPMALRGGETGAAGPAAPSAEDPTSGYTLMEAVEKQLGLKLEKQKRTMPVIVIDHIEPRPTEN